MEGECNIIYRNVFPNIRSDVGHRPEYDTINRYETEYSDCSEFSLNIDKDKVTIYKLTDVTDCEDFKVVMKYLNDLKDYTGKTIEKNNDVEFIQDNEKKRGRVEDYDLDKCQFKIFRIENTTPCYHYIAGKDLTVAKSNIKY